MLRIMHWAEEQEFTSRQFTGQTTPMFVSSAPCFIACSAPRNLKLELPLYYIEVKMQ